MALVHAEVMMRIETVTLPSMASPSLVAQRLAGALERAKVVRFAAGNVEPNGLDPWLEVMRCLGQPLIAEEGATGRKGSDFWLDVSYRPDRQYTFRHSASAQPLHTDGAYDDCWQKYVLFLCQNTLATGGATLFLDVDELVAMLRLDAPDLLSKLCTQPVRFGKNDEPGRDVTVLRRSDAHSGAWTVNWNYYRVAADNDQATLDLCDRFHRYLQEAVILSGRATEVLLQPGEGAIFRDREVLHGRHAFEAREPLERCIWKCAVA